MKPSTIYMVRTPHGLSPSSPYDAEQLDRYALGTEVEVTARQKRSVPNHRHFFALLSRLVKGGAVPFPTTDALLDALKLTLGVTEVYQDLAGNYYVRPSSVAFSQMDEGAFREFKEGALAAISERYGVDVNAV